MTKEINKKEVEKICDLANINVDESEKEKFADELGDILTYIEKLDELDTDGIKPTAYPVPLKNVLREDKVGESLSEEKALKNAPEKNNNQFEVPPIMSD
ncbi:MAG: Asp-tRNA(Asn)/Glu-tRNA(Gln) amidotransferase subunit GatC [Bacillota bacterium]